MCSTGLLIPEKIIKYGIHVVFENTDSIFKREKLPFILFNSIFLFYVSLNEKMLLISLCSESSQQCFNNVTKMFRAFYHTLVLGQQPVTYVLLL